MPSATRVQQLIQEILTSLAQFSESWQRAGGSGVVKPQEEPPPCTSSAPPAAEKNAGEQETSSAPSKMNLSQEWSEKVTELVTTNTSSQELAKKPPAFELDSLRLLYEEFLLRKARLEEDEAWIELYKEKLDNLSNGAESFTLDGREVATYKRNGNLNTKRLEAEHPEVIEKYTRLVTEMKFDREAFGKDEPELFQAYRAKVFRLPGARGIKTQ